MYLQELSNTSIDEDPKIFLQVINSRESNKWLDAMKDELTSIKANNVWELVKFLEVCTYSM